MTTPRPDPLDMTLRALLERVLQEPARSESDAREWINVRTDDWPWRRIVAAAERGELVVARVGRKLIVRREDLGRWLEAQRIPARTQTSQAQPPSRVAHLLDAAGYRRSGT
jgi:hypothetical protein